MKICPNCNAAFDDSVASCDKCGTYLIPATKAQPQYQAQPQEQQSQPQDFQPQYQTQPQYQYQTDPQAPPKKKKTGLIIGIVVAVVVLILAGIGFTAEKIFQNQGYGESADNEDIPAINEDFEEDYAAEEDNDDSSTVKKPYTKGSIQGNKYINEWANISFDITGWTNGDTEIYADMEYSEYVDCGLYLTDILNNKIIMITFTKIPTLESNITETEIVNIIIDGLKNRIDEQNVEYEVSDFYDYVIADEMYTNVYIDLYNNSVVEDVYVRKHDGYIIQIVVTADNINTSCGIVDQITPVE